MASCPNCKSKIQTKKVIFLKPKENYYQCSNCNFICEIEIEGRTAGAVGFFMLGVALWATANYFDHEKGLLWYCGLGLFLILFGYAIYYFIKTVWIRPYMGKANSVNEILNLKKKEFNAQTNNKMKEMFVKSFLGKSDSELNEIISSPKYTVDAKKAAQHVLDNRGA